MPWLQPLWIESVRDFLARRRRSAKKGRGNARLRVEQLEDRCLPATLTPTTFTDGLGIGSLRDAILRANGNSQNNTIQLTAGTYNLSLAGRGENAGTTGDLDLSAAGFTEIIQGAGAGVTFINAASIDRAFQVLGNVRVVFRDLTITGGLATDSGGIGGSAALGGGILNNGGNVTLDHVAVVGN